MGTGGRCVMCVGRKRATDDVLHCEDNKKNNKRGGCGEAKGCWVTSTRVMWMRGD